MEIVFDSLINSRGESVHYSENVPLEAIFLLFLEPSSQADQRYARKVQALTKEIQKQGRSIAVVWIPVDAEKLVCTLLRPRA
jgi:hypothetical protein